MYQMNGTLRAVCLGFALALAPALLSTPLAAAEPTAEERARLEKERSAAREALRDATKRLREVERELRTDRERRVIERIRIGDRAMLGVTVDDSDDRRDRDAGVLIAGVSPGGPSATAGLKAGDVIVAIDGKSLKADRDESPFEKLRTVLRERKPGDTVTLKVQRDGKTTEHKVTTEALGARGFAFNFDGESLADLGGLMELWTPEPGAAPRPLPMPFMHRFSRVWSDLEMVSLSERLGAYFGAKQGVLVVRAPDDAGLKLEDGDIILKVGEREATSPEQVMRVLRSYGPGETLKMEVMRDRKRVTVEGKVPDGRVGWLELPVAPPAPPQPAVPQ